MIGSRKVRVGPGVESVASFPGGGANAVWTRPSASTVQMRPGFGRWRRAAPKRHQSGSHPGPTGYVFQVETVYVAEQLRLSSYQIPIFFEIGASGIVENDLWRFKLIAAWRALEICCRRGATRQISAVANLHQPTSTENS